MKRTLLLLCIAFSTFSTLQAQKKSDLIAEIATLKTQLDSLTNEVAVARRSEKSSLAKAESFEAQSLELRDANKTLMKNLSSFSQLSSQNSTNMNKAMESLSQKENQLKVITDAFASNDSTALVVLTNAKQTLGENAKIGVTDGVVIISSPLTSLFAADTETTTLTTESETWLLKIAAILTANPNTNLTIEGLTMTGELNVAAQQANTIATTLQKMDVTADRINSLGKDGGFKEGMVLKIHPKYERFYTAVKESMKN